MNTSKELSEMLESFRKTIVVTDVPCYNIDLWSREGPNSGAPHLLIEYVSSSLRFQAFAGDKLSGEQIRELSIAVSLSLNKSSEHLEETINNIKDIDVEYVRSDVPHRLRLLKNGSVIFDEAPTEAEHWLTYNLGKMRPLTPSVAKELSNFDKVNFKDEIINVDSTLAFNNPPNKVNKEDLKTSRDNQKTSLDARNLAYAILQQGRLRRGVSPFETVMSPYVNDSTLVALITLLFNEGLDYLELDGEVKSFEVSLIPLNEGSTYRFVKIKWSTVETVIELKIV